MVASRAGQRHLAALGGAVRCRVAAAAVSPASRRRLPALSPWTATRPRAPRRLTRRQKDWSHPLDTAKRFELMQPIIEHWDANDQSSEVTKVRSR